MPILAKKISQLGIQRSRPKQPPATEEQGGNDPRDGKTVCQFDGVEKAEPHAGVFGVIAGSEFGFSLGDVHRCAIQLGTGGNEVDRQCERLEENQQAVMRPLPGDNAIQVHRARKEDNPEQREHHRNLIADGHRDDAHRSKQRILVVR